MKRWWRVIIIVPIMSMFTLLITYKFAFVFLTWTSFPVKINPLLAIKIIAITNSLLIPYLNWRIYKINYWISLTFWVLATITGIVTTPTFKENSNLQLIEHLILYHLIAIILTMLLTAIIVRKKTKLAN